MFMRKVVDFWSRLGETSWGLRNVLCVCWVSEYRADDAWIVRNCISLLTSKNLKLKKGKKVSCLNQFRMFSDSYVYEHLWTFSVSVWICLFHIFISWSYFWTYISWIELTKRRSKWYPAKTITDADYADDLALLANTPNQAETLLHSLERAAAGIGLHVNTHKTEYMCYNQTGNIATLDGASLKLVDKFTLLGSSVSSTEKDIDRRLTKAWTAIDGLSVIWKSDLTDKMKRSFFQAAVVSILLYGCSTWTLTKRLEKKLDGNYTRMLRAVLDKSWRQHPTRHQLYGHLLPIPKTIQVRRTRHAGHCWRSRNELISDVLQWTPTYGRAKAGRPARTYIQQLCEDTGCNPEDLPEAMSDREKWRERVRDIHADGRTWWWWWWYYKSLLIGLVGRCVC